MIALSTTFYWRTMSHHQFISCSLFSPWDVSDSFRPHELQHARLPCSSLSPWVCLNSCPLSQWCHPTISSSCCSLLLLCSIFPSSQSIGASTSTSVLPMNIQGQFPLGLTGLISMQSKGLSKVSSNTTIRKHQFLGIWAFLWFSSHIYT